MPLKKYTLASIVLAIIFLIATITFTFKSKLSAQATTDVLTTNGGLFFDLARNVSWGVSSKGGINNNFIFSPYNGQLGTCVWMVNNNPVSAHTFNLFAFSTGDPSVTSFTGQSSQWLPASIFNISAPGGVFGGNLSSAIQPSAIETFFIPTRGVARFTVSITGTTSSVGSPDTATLFVTFTSTSSCNYSTNGPGDIIGAPDINSGGFSKPIWGADSTNYPPYEGLLVAPLTGVTALNLTTQPVNNPSNPASGPFLVEKGARWSVTNTGVFGSNAVATEAAGAAGVRHVVDCIAFSAVSTGAIAAPSDLVLEVLDGAVPFWVFVAAAPATAGTGVQIVSPTHFCGLGIVGSPATSMTI